MPGARLADADDAVRAIVVTGAGRAFCAGQDLADPSVAPDPTPGAAPKDLGHVISSYYAPLVARLRSMPVPVVAAVNGVAAGAGANLAFAGDIVIARASANFIQSFCRLGLIPDTGGTFVLPRLVGRARAMGLAMLGDKLSAKQAEEWGLIWQCVADEEFDATLDRLAKHFSTAPTKGLAFTKRAMQASLGNDLSTQLDLERDMMRELGRSADYAEGVAAFLGKREPQFKGQ